MEIANRESYSLLIIQQLLFSFCFSFSFYSSTKFLSNQRDVAENEEERRKQTKKAINVEYLQVQRSSQSV